MRQLQKDNVLVLEHGPDGLIDASAQGNQHGNEEKCFVHCDSQPNRQTSQGGNFPRLYKLFYSDLVHNASFSIPA
jgi:hypothetical protein